MLCVLTGFTSALLRQNHSQSDPIFTLSTTGVVLGHGIASMMLAQAFKHLKQRGARCWLAHDSGKPASAILVNVRWRDIARQSDDGDTAAEVSEPGRKLIASEARHDNIED